MECINVLMKCINGFWKGNKTKSGNKDTLWSGSDRDIPPKITVQPEFFL